MKHFLFFKYGRIYYELIYELWGDDETAIKFQKSLTFQKGFPIILTQVK